MWNDGFNIETEIFWCGAYAWEPASMRIWVRACRNARVIVDVGANTGVYALVAKALNPAARIYAFEPLARIHQRLVENAALNRFDIVCRAEALSNYDGEGRMFDLPADNVYGATLNRDMYIGETLPSIARPVTVRRLSTFLDETGVIPDLLKIDVESHEPEVIEGLGAALEHRPSMLVEVWHDGEHGGLEMGKRVEATVAGRGYLYFRLDDTHGPVREEHIGRPGRGYSNYFICTPEAARSLGL
jgi:FkbM family methyltransferase